LISRAIATEGASPVRFAAVVDKTEDQTSIPMTILGLLSKVHIPGFGEVEPKINSISLRPVIIHDRDRSGYRLKVLESDVE